MVAYFFKLIAIGIRQLNDRNSFTHLGQDLLELHIRSQGCGNPVNV
jgi:hypothetical protein